MSNIYSKNFVCIEKHSEIIAKKLLKETKEDFHPNIEILSSNNFLIKQGAKEILSYPLNDEFTLLNKSLEKIELFDDECSIQIGVGNGYMLNKILKNSSKKHLVILIETIPKLLNLAFSNYDYSRYIEAGKLVICTDQDELTNMLSLIESNKVIQLWHSFAESYTVFLNQFYADVTKLALDTINQMMCNTGTVVGAGALIAENDIKNLPHIIKHRGVKEIKDLFKNKPAVIILSAPSVIDLIPQLLDNNYRNKVIIIAIAQMLRPLLAFDIKPDFICTVDYGEVNYEHFDGLFYIKDVPLVALNRSYSRILKEWQGPKFIVTGYNPTNENTVVEMLNEKGQLDQGGSVGHMAIGLAIHLGCNPIIHIGFDCAYNQKDGLSHNQLGDANGKINFRDDGSIDWDVTDPNSTIQDNHKMGDVVLIPGYFGGLVPTNSGLASFVLAMENIFSSYPKIKFINSCEGGAKKKHCEQMSFKKALKDFCNKKINKTKINKYLSFKPQFEKDIWEAKRRLNWEIVLFDQIVDACDNGLKPLKSMQDATENELKELLSENEKFATMAQELTKQSNILSLHIYKTSREIHKRELKVNGKTKHLLKDKEDLEIRIKRSSLILEAAKESALKLKKIYIQVFVEMVDLTCNEIKKNELVLNSVNLYLEKMDKWDKLLENGNWARPLLESEEIMEEYMTDPTKIDVFEKAKLFYYKSLKMKMDFLEENKKRQDLTNEIEINKFIELSRECGLKKDFKGALKYLKKALKINSLKVEVIWGLATTYHHLEKVNKALKYYKFLVKCYPENNKRYRFEMGQTYLLKDIQKGMEIISNVMEETHEFDSFYIRLAELEFGMEDYYKAKEYCEKFLMVYSHSTEAKNLLDRINKIEKPY
jgi:hypothetical protein